MRRLRSRRALLQSLESRRLFTIAYVSGPASVDSDEDKLLQSLATAPMAGTSLIAYADRDSGTGKGVDVYLRKTDITGAPTGSEQLINTTFSGAQQNPDIAATNGNRYAIAWQSEGQDGDGWGIYVRTFAPGSSLATAETLVNQTTTGDQVNPRVAMDPASGAFVVTWLDADSNNGEIFARRFNANGTTNGNAFKVSGSSSVAYASPKVAMRSGGAFAIVYEARNPSGDNTADVLLQAYNSSGVAVGSAVTVHPSTANDQSQPAIAAVGSGYGVVYIDDTGSATSAYHRRYDATGTAAGSAVLSSQENDGVLSRPAIAGDADGNLVVGWTLKHNVATHSHTLIRAYGQNGAATGNEFEDGDDSSVFTLYGLEITNAGWYRAVTTASNSTGYGIGGISTYANVLDVVGTVGKDTITVRDADAGKTIRVNVNGTQVDYDRTAYAYLRASLGAEADLFNAAAQAGNTGVTTLPVSVTGGDGADTIWGGGGGDSLFGEGGTDEVHGGASKDYITGGDDNDLMYGDAGNDNLVTGSGKNTVYGGDGDDRVAGSGGHDKFYGESGLDRLYGNAGNDTMDGGGGTDRLYGGDGTDSLMGGSSNDRLYGEVGDDTVTGGAGTDYLFGGDGVDMRKGAEASDIVDSIEITG